MNQKEGAFKTGSLIAGRYQVLDYLGGGEITEVYKTKDLVGARIVALKISREPATKEIENQLNQEFFMLSRFNHPNIVAPFDFGITERKPFFTMEYFPGAPINKFFKGYSEDLLLVLIEILYALDTIHSQGLIHCDLKPQNILVNTAIDSDTGNKARAKLLDFGFANYFSSSNQIPRGTLGYIAPEIFKGTEADGRADLYSLGMVIYEILTGRGPSTETDLRNWLRIQYYSNFTPPSEIDSKIPEKFSNLCMRLLARDAFRRPISALEVIETISDIIPESLKEKIPTIGIRRSGEGVFSLQASSFIGRENELNVLRNRLESAKGSNGQLVFITGERGVGKSRLLQEFKFLAKLEGVSILQSAHTALGARPPSLIEDILANLSIYDGKDIKDIVAKQEDEATKYELFEEIIKKLKALANSSKIEHSLLLLIDNFELFDSMSLEFLRFLGFSIEKEKIFVVVSSLNERRILELSKEFLGKEFFQHITLGPLTQEETQLLVEAILGPHPSSAELSTWLFASTGGNPLFVIESLYSLLASKVIQLEYGRWRLDRNRLTSGDFKLPDTVYSLIKERLSTLTREELEVLKVGAITGTPFTVDFVRAVLGYEEHLLYSIFSRLRAINLLRPLPDSDGFVLSSKTLEAIITEGISVQERRDYHRSVALAIELLYPREQDRYLFDLAHHYTQAGIKDRAFNYCREAGAKAKRLNLTELALGFYETALALSSNFVSARERIELIEAVGRLREITGRFADAIDIYTQGLGILFSDNTLRREPNYVSLLASVLRRLGLIYQKQGKVDESISYFKQALTTLKEKDAVGTITLWNDIGWSLTAKGDFKKAEEFYSLALKTIDLKNSESLVDLKARTLYGMSALAWYKGEIDLALEYANRGLALYEKPAPAREEVESNWISSKSNLRGKIGQFLATIYWQKGELNKAKETYSSILSSPLWELSDVYFRIRTIQGLGLVDFETGDWHQALEYFKEAKELCEKIGDSAGLGDTLCNLGIILEEMGDWQKATAYYQKDIEIRQNIRDDNGLVIGLINLANLFTKKGDFIDAEPLLKEAENLTKQNKNQQILGQIYLAWAKLHLMRDQLDSAIKSLALALNVQRIYAKGNKQKLIEMLLTAAGIRAAEADWSKCLTTCERAQNLLTLPAAEGQAYNANPRLYSLLLRWRGLAKHALGFTDDGKEELNRSIEILRSLGAKYEMAKSLYYQAQASLLLLTAPKTYNQGEPLPITYKPLSEQELTRVLDDLKEAETIFTSLGAKVEQERVRYMLNHISQLEATHKLKGRERGEYLKVFYELSELINLDLEKEDFADRLLDLIIDVTQAERGLLFLIQGDKLFPVAARNVDHTTLEDAHTISRTVIRQVKKRAEPIICADALSDPRFVNSNSVVLNKIRSLVCVPLRIDDKVIGTIYLDSRINPNVFVEEDKNLLISVANLLAATIDRSFAFKKMQEDFSALREDILTDAVTGYFLGRSKAIKDVYSIIEQIAPTDCTVLLLGETGSGKGVLARLIHANSNRRANKFVSINCGTLPETLFESELFGHCKGAFTGAIRDKEGLFEIAEHGTIFMDEIANTSLSIQAKLLEVLEDKIIRRVGETEPRRVDVRLICATNKNLEEEVKANRFREDLYYRLNVVTIQVPPLRERKSDIMLLAGYFLKRYAKQLNKPILGFEDNIPQILTEYPWPGNVRELQNVIERAVIMAQKRKISLENLGPKIVNFAKTMKIEKGQKKSLEREQVIEALKATQGNVSRAAQMLSTHRRQIQRLLRRYNINKEDFQSS
ncbi:MAG: sigma 54-interacting transcriptional regulator [candidate division WOR-3 bacterium]